MWDTALADTKDVPMPTPTLNILIADDSEANQALFSLYLSDDHYQLYFAGNGHEAINACKKIPFDLIFMDLIMPGIDGHDATRRIRNHENEKGLSPTPIVAVSADTLPESKEKSVHAGCTDFLAKPFRKAELLGCVERNLTER